MLAANGTLLNATIGGLALVFAAGIPAYISIRRQQLVTSRTFKSLIAALLPVMTALEETMAKNRTVGAEKLRESIEEFQKESSKLLVNGDKGD